MNIMCWSLLWAFLANKNDLTLHPRLPQSQVMSCRTGSRCWPSYLVRWVMKCYPDLKPSMISPASRRCPITIFYWWYAYHPQIVVVDVNWFTTNYGPYWYTNWQFHEIPYWAFWSQGIRGHACGLLGDQLISCHGKGMGWHQHIFNYQQLHFISSHVSLYVIQTTTNLDLRLGSMWSNQVTTITTIVSMYIYNSMYYNNYAPTIWAVL